VPFTGYGLLGLTLLRDGLLEGRTVALAGGAPTVLADALAGLGARVSDVAPVHGLVYWSGSSFGDGGAEGLRACVDEAWAAISAIATGALIPGGAGGKILLLSPRPDAGPFAGAARAALENLARTLSVEWARYAITAVAVAPGRGTTDSELAELMAYLVSPAGDYFSGCAFELGSGTMGA
jgi:NAD(P)-dependent dehydrogenase (short-subunit alcohol dehydrogenase family)